MIDAQQIADVLIEAERDRRPVPPFTRAHPFLDVETAYKAQSLFVEHRLQAGDVPVGFKLGMTSKVKRRALGIDQPVHGVLTAAMIIPHGDRLPVGELIDPVAEPEIAFLMKEQLEGPVTVARVLRATEVVFAAIEVTDSRYSTSFRLPDSIADNAGAARVALGTHPVRPRDLADLRLIGSVFQARSRIIATAAAGAAMGHPAAGVAWLTRSLAARGESLRPGSLVLSGGLTRAVPLRPAGFVTAQFDGLGSIDVYC